MKNQLCNIIDKDGDIAKRSLLPDHAVKEADSMRLCYPHLAPFVVVDVAVDVKTRNGADVLLLKCDTVTGRITGQIIHSQTCVEHAVWDTVLGTPHHLENPDFDLVFAD